MGGIAVDSDTAAARGVPRLFAAGEVAGGMHRLQPARRQLPLGPAGVRPAGRAARGDARRRGSRPAGRVRAADRHRGGRALRPFSAEGPGRRAPSPKARTRCTRNSSRP
ncbi:hypothetical protein [Streptomyces sp. KL116D]|uniref:hypothetical protein n=1 Tax=Streptomyces sp. KL116D TaxID=3045152 RepID=UPI0035569B25